VNKFGYLIADKIIIELALCSDLQLCQRAKEHKVKGVKGCSCMSPEGHGQDTTVTQQPQAALGDMRGCRIHQTYGNLPGRNLVTTQVGKAENEPPH
jgi:hypothetical protein